MKKYLRQRGIVDQMALMSKRILVSGSPNGIGELLVLLVQLGFGGIRGSIGIVNSIGGQVIEMPKSIFWKLYFGKTPSWSEWEKSMKEANCSVELIEKDLLINKDWDIHLTLEPNTHTLGDINGFVNGLRGKIFHGSKDETTLKAYEVTPNSNHPVHSSMRTIVAATVVNDALKRLSLKTIIPVSDCWLTVTSRVESTDLDFVRAHVKGINGELLDVTLSQDGLATIARYRYPNVDKIDMFALVNVHSQPYEDISEIDVGLVPWSEPSGEKKQVLVPSVANISILGIGGLGSWATPLICAALKEGDITIIDGDDNITLHNLNRQVLFREEDIGCAKSETAESRLKSLFPRLNINSYRTFFNRIHISENTAEVIDLNEIFMDSSIRKVHHSPSCGSSQNQKIRQALKNSNVCLSCLDNMQARTLLNEAALKHEIPMINGGGESIHGIVERLFNEGCMVCRYGKEAANASEIISCTEEGTRPIPSIVTTTAWVGAMMAAITILELAGSPVAKSQRYTWFDGKVSRDQANKPPWFNEECVKHI